MARDEIFYALTIGGIAHPVGNKAFIKLCQIECLSFVKQNRKRSG